MLNVPVKVAPELPIVPAFTVVAVTVVKRPVFGVVAPTVVLFKEPPLMTALPVLKFVATTVVLLNCVVVSKPVLGLYESVLDEKLAVLPSVLSDSMG